MTLISVIIPAFNRSEKLSRAVQSVLDQSCQQFEILIVDDGSTDDTSTVAASLAASDHRIRYVAHTSNRGAQAARNTGIKAAKGQWIAFLDSFQHSGIRSLEFT